MEFLNTSHPANRSSSVITSLLSESPYTTVEIVFIILVAGSLSLVTIIGNILVMVSIKVNRNLQTVNNYFLFSLACADLIIGLCSMNLYTVYIVIGHWPLGPVVCDLWLAVDYVVSNASVMNLLIISFDRYFCVTKPLSYPVRRSTKMAGMMIAGAWILSFILWAPAILFWQFIVGGRTVPEGECYIQFFSNAAVTFGTAIAAFYLPVAIMIGLYWRISRASRSRVRRDSRKYSGTSVGEGPSPSQDKGESQRSDDVVMQEEEVEVADGDKKKEMEQQQNGSGPCKEEIIDGENSTNDSSMTVSIPASSSNQKEEEEVKSSPASLSQRKFNGGSKPSQTKRSSKKKARNSVSNQNAPNTNTSATERQNLVTRTLFKVTKNSPVIKVKKKGCSSRERKVTRTIMAILVAFVATWTPYNVMVLINTFCSSCIPPSLWTIGYWLCYINSTINPACYALCNTTFKNTFKHLLLCQYKNIRSMR